MNVYLDMYIDRQNDLLFICMYVLTHICMYIGIYVYMCHRNKYVPYYDRVLMLWQGNPSLLNYDDVITLCC